MKKQYIKVGRKRINKKMYELDNKLTFYLILVMLIGSLNVDAIFNHVYPCQTLQPSIFIIELGIVLFYIFLRTINHYQYSEPIYEVIKK